MVGSYTSLPPAVAATVPRRTVLRDSWIIHSPSGTETSRKESNVSQSPSSTPPLTPNTPNLGELRQKWDTPRPASVIVTTYAPPRRDEAHQMFQDITGKVSKAKAFFESAPLNVREKDVPTHGIMEELDDPPDTIVSYKVQNPFRNSPKPKPRRLRNTISTFPKWTPNENKQITNDNESDSEVQVIVADVLSSSEDDEQKETETETPIEITNIKPSFIRRRYGTVTGLISDQNNIERVLKNRLEFENSLKKEKTSMPSKFPQSLYDEKSNLISVNTDAETALADAEGRGVSEVTGSPDNNNTIARGYGGGYDSVVDEIHRAKRVPVNPSVDPEIPTLLENNKPAFSWGREGEWNRSNVAAPVQSPIATCRCDIPQNQIINQSFSKLESLNSSECQGSAAIECHVSSSSDTMIVVPEDGPVQAAAPRVVAACIKSYHDIPEELFNSLQESSVDPQSASPSPPPPPPPSSPPPTHNSMPTATPRSDWKTMQEGRKALLMGAVSDADTEEGSEIELGGVASTSDYHTSDGRGSSLSGASDDHHHNDHLKYNHYNHDRRGFDQHTQGDHCPSTNTKDVDEDAEFDCYNPQVSPPTALIKNNFRGFCSTMLGSVTMPTSREMIFSPPPTRYSNGNRIPTTHIEEPRPSSASSLLEEELRAAGVYFRRPGSPPQVPSRSRTLSPPPRPPPSSIKLERNISVGEAEAVAAALHVLDASLAGLSDSSGESSPSRSHSSTVIERLQSSLDHSTGDTHSSSTSSSLSSSCVEPHLPAVSTTPSVSSTERLYSTSHRHHSDTSDSASNPSVNIYNSDVNDSDSNSIVDYSYDSRLSRPGLKDIPPPSSRSTIVRGGLGRASSTLGGLGEDGGPYYGPQQHIKQQKDSSSLENFNLIEEVYVDTRPVHNSTVSMRAYYPGVHYDASTSSHPKSCLKPPHPPPSSTSTSLSRHAERGASLDSTQTMPGDSDSGHESGATSPCGTLILDDTQSPPPSPPNKHMLKSHSISIHTHAPPHPHSHTSSLHSCRGPGVLESEVGVAVVGDPSITDMNMGGIALEPRPPTHFVVVAIDFGTTYSGYAFSFTRDPDSIHMMKKWEGGDPGVQNQKTPTIVLLTPEEEFHSMGFIARDTYHDLDPKDAKKWLYFDKFKMALHADQSLSRDTLLEAANGRKVPALKIFSYALQYFRDHALKELSDQAGVEVLEEDVRWVITVPAIWSHPAKQFMRTAAYQAGMGSSSRPEQLLIALEPEAAAIYCRRLRRHQLLPERPSEIRSSRVSVLKDSASLPQDSNSVSALPELDREELVSLPYRSVETVADWLNGDTVYAVVDCGGGTVDITVHQMTDKSTGHLKELHKATGGPHGSTGVDGEFERLLETIFGADFLQTFRQQRPAAYVDLMIAFESRKRNASPYRSNPLNIALPFSFIDLYRKFRGKDVEWAMKKHQNLGVKWSAQGMLRVEQETMRQLFMSTLTSITQAIEAVLSAPEVGHLQYMFLVGGFAESELLQKHIRDTFGHRVNVIIPQGMGLAILRGAVQFGLDPGVVTVRRSRLTYGVGVLNRYQQGLHPSDKRVVAAGAEWCADVLDRFVVVDESIAVGDVVVRPYTPATPGQSTVILHLYATDRHDAKFVTEDGVQRVGTLHLELGDALQDECGKSQGGRREITVHMKFGDTEVKASAVDHLTGQIVRANIDFLAL